MQILAARLAIFTALAAGLAWASPLQQAAGDGAASFRGSSPPVIRHAKHSYPFMYVGTAATVAQEPAEAPEAPPPILASEAVMGPHGPEPAHPAPGGAEAEEDPPTLSESSVMWESDSVADQLRQAAETHADAALAIRQAAAALKDTANSLRQGAYEATHASERLDGLKAAIRDHIGGAEGDMGNLERALVPQDQLQAAVAVAMAPAAPPLASPPAAAPTTTTAPYQTAPAATAAAALPLAPAAAPPMAPAGPMLFRAPGSATFTMPPPRFAPTMFPPPVAVFPPMPPFAPAPAAILSPASGLSPAR